MIKLQWQEDQEALWEACGGVMSSMVNTDTGVKSAASEVISRDILEQHRPDKDHWLQHVVALGDYETWGENRNADAYTKKANMECHPTFVKFGHFFREHRHHDPSLKIGDIKYAAYNPTMKRVELLVWGNKKLAAAEYEDAKAGKTHTYSMACKVAKDVCNICGHEAKSPALWCEHMKTARGKYIPEFKKYAFVFNPNPRFFDISDVGYPADRTAYGLRCLFGEKEAAVKAASGDRVVINGAEWAEMEGITVPAALADEIKTASASKSMEQLAALEREIESGLKNSTQDMAGAIKAAMTVIRIHALPADDMDALRRVPPATLFRHLAERKIILPLPEFASMLFGDSPACMEQEPAVHEAANLMKGGIFTKVVERGVPVDAASLFAAGGHNAARIGSSYNDAFDNAIHRAEDLFGLDAERCGNLLIKSSFAEPIQASEEGAITLSSDKLASAYTQYVAQAVTDMQSLADMEDYELGLLAGKLYSTGGLYD